MANETRGEIALSLDAEYVMRPTFEAIVAFETKTGKGVLQLANEAGSRRLTLSDATAIACACINAQGRAIGDKALEHANADKIGRLILDSEGGVAEAMGRIAALLIHAATGGYTASGEMKAGANIAETPTAA